MIPDELETRAAMTRPGPPLMGIRWSHNPSGLLSIDTEGGLLLPLSLESLRLEGPFARLRLPGVHQYYQYPNLVGDRLYYGARQDRTDVWSLRLDAETGEALGEPEQLTTNATRARGPSIASDGSQIAYGLVDPASDSVRPWVQRLSEGGGHALSDRITPVGRISLSPEGARAAFTGRESERDYVLNTDYLSSEGLSLFLASARFEGKVRELCRDCGFVGGWSRDGTRILTAVRNATGSEVRSVDAESAESQTLFACMGCELRSPIFSPDGQAVVFSRERDDRTQVMLARLSGASDGPPPESSWQTLTAGPGRDDFPALSSDGKRVYFLSDRDGRACIWMKRLDAKSRAATGEAVAIYHSHDRWFSLGAAGWGRHQGLAVGADLVVFMMRRAFGNVWMIEAPRFAPTSD